MSNLTQLAPPPYFNVRKPTVLNRLVKSPVFWVMIIAAVLQFCFYRQINDLPREISDTPSYLKSPRLQHGEVDLWRTPCYPYFIAAIKSFSSEGNLLRRVVLAQQVISWICIFFFFQTARRLLKSTIVTACASLYFACHPSILWFNTYVLTESLSISGTVFLIYLLVSYLSRPGYIKAVVIGIIILFLIMLRPFFLVLLPIFLVLWTVRLVVIREHRFREAVGLFSAIIALMLVLGYGQLFKQQHGVFSWTAASSHVNQFAMVFQSGFYRNGRGDPAITEWLIEREEVWKKKNPNATRLTSRLIAPDTPMHGAQIGFEMAFVFDEGSPKMNERPKYVKDTIRSDRFRWYRYLLGRFGGIGADTFEDGFWSSGFPNKSTDIDWRIGLTFQSVYVILLLEIITLGVIFYHTRRVPWFWSVCWLLIAGIIVTAVIGSMNDWNNRLTVSAIPLVILLLARYVDLIVDVVKETCGIRIVQYLKEQSTLPEEEVIP